MVVVGLTGGIGSGKTTVAERFAARGVPVVDADAIARELVTPGAPALAVITERFGAEVLDGEGRLDRRRLREQVFADPARRRQLEAILHPRIRAEIRQRLAALPAATPYAVVVIPLLVESGWRDLVDRVLVVDVPRAQQIERTSRRDGATTAQVEAILAAQATREERLAAADDVVYNEGEPADLDHQIDALDAQYRELARRSGA